LLIEIKFLFYSTITKQNMDEEYGENDGENDEEYEEGLFDFEEARREFAVKEEDEEEEEEEEEGKKKEKEKEKEKEQELDENENEVHRVLDIGLSQNITKIIRGKNRRTQPYVTKYEYCRFVEARYKQLDSGKLPNPKVDITGIDKSIDIAVRELHHRPENEKYEFPITLYRPLPDGTHEEWFVSEMTFVDELYDDEEEGVI
jgi:hypothetical protein